MNVASLDRSMKAAAIQSVIGNRLYDSSGNITFLSGATVPSNGTTGYASGCIFTQNDATTTGTYTYMNTGTATSSTWTSLAATIGMELITVPLTSYDFDGSYASQIFVAPVAYTLVYVREVHQALATSIVATLKKASGTTAFAGYTADTGGTKLHTQGQLTLGAAINTVVSPTITVSSISAGDRIAVVASGAPTGYQGCVTLGLTPA